jgi:hypothetical protein
MATVEPWPFECRPPVCEYGDPSYFFWTDKTAPDRVTPKPKRKITERFDKDGNLIERVTEDLEFED